MLKTSKLITANTWFEMDFLKYRRTLALRALIRHRLRDLGVDTGLKPLVAIVNHGRWLVICPDCGGAEYAWEEGFMMCMSCFNAKVAHRFRPFTFPSKREKIEELLIQRSLPNRNWSLGETVSDLKRENQEHHSELLVKEVKSNVMDNSSSS